MRIHVLLYAAYRELFGQSRLQIEVPDGTTSDELYALLEQEQPRLALMRPYTTFAVNQEVVSPFDALHHGDEVAFLQPASGG